jgi:O-glycosyl hydrolase
MYEEIKLDLDACTRQEFLGFGTSLSWFANAIGTRASNEVKDYICNILFDQNSEKSLQLNIVRYNIGGWLEGCESKLRNGGNIPGYSNKEDWDKTDLGQRYFLKKAKELGVETFEAFSNSPPVNMTVSGGVEGHKYRCRNNLKSDKIQDFSDYLVNVTTYLKKHDDIPFKSISPMNEPSGPGWIVGSGQEGCFYGFLGIRRKLIKAVYKKLNDSDPDSKRNTLCVSACEESNMLQALFGILINPFIWKYVDQYNVHRYTIGNALKFNTFNLEDSNILRKLIHTIMGKCLKKEIWMSEWGMGKMDGGDWEIVSHFANSLINDLNYLKPIAWVYWQVIEDFSGNGWGCLQIPFDNPTIESIVYSVQFTTFQHFTHFIKKGCRLLNLKKPKNKNLKWVGYVKDNKITLIILSKNTQNIDIQFDVCLYNIKKMCTYRLLQDNNVKIEHDFIKKTNSISLPSMSLTSLTFSIIQ